MARLGGMSSPSRRAAAKGRAPKRSLDVAIADYAALGPAALQNEMAWTKAMIARLNREHQAQQEAWRKLHPKGSKR